MASPWDNRQPGLEAPFQDLKTVTLDTPFPAGTARGLWIGAAGTVNITTANGTVLTGVKVVAGVFPVGVSLVTTGGTVAAADIWAGY